MNMAMAANVGVKLQHSGKAAAAAAAAEHVSQSSHQVNNTLHSTNSAALHDMVPAALTLPPFLTVVSLAPV
jgi:hypothetical protein